MQGSDIIQNTEMEVELALESRIAQYVAIYAPDWHLKDKKTVQCLLGKQLIIEEFEQELTQGYTYSYPSTALQGLTQVSLCPGLYCSMAPDQYSLPEETTLPEEIQKKILDLFQDSTDENQKILLREEFQKRKFKTYHNDNFVAIETCLQKMSITISPLIAKNLSLIMQAWIGFEYTQAISALCGKYTAITLSRENLSETAGFNIPLKLQSHLTKKSCKEFVCSEAPEFKTISLPRLMMLEKHHSHLRKHLIIQSDIELTEKVNVTNKKNEIEEKTITGKLALHGNDFHYLTQIYEETIPEKIALIVNCTEGVDRTGIIILALTMYHLYRQNQGHDFTLFSEEKQQIFLIELIYSLRKDRGPKFLRIEEDIMRGILLGYALIATYQLQKNPNLENIEKIIAKHQNICAQFSYFNREFKPLFTKIHNIKNLRITNRKYSFNNAPAELFIKIIQNGFDQVIIKNKTLYHFAVDTYFGDRTAENLEQLKLLRKHGGNFAHNLMVKQFEEKGLQPNLIESLLSDTTATDEPIRHRKSLKIKKLSISKDKKRRSNSLSPEEKKALIQNLFEEEKMPSPTSEEKKTRMLKFDIFKTKTNNDSENKSTKEKKRTSLSSYSSTSKSSKSSKSSNSSDGNVTNSNSSSILLPHSSLNISTSSDNTPDDIESQFGAMKISISSPVLYHPESPKGKDKNNKNRLSVSANNISPNSTIPVTTNNSNNNNNNTSPKPFTTLKLT